MKFHRTSYEKKIKCICYVPRYDVAVTCPLWRKDRGVRKSDKPLLTRAFDLLKKANPGKFKKPYAVAYDGQAVSWWR
jgi:hypothetical protein